MKDIRRITDKQFNFIGMAICRMYGKGQGPKTIKIGSSTIIMKKLNERTMLRTEATKIIEQIIEKLGVKPEKKIPVKKPDKKIEHVEIQHVEKGGVLWLETV